MTERPSQHRYEAAESVSPDAVANAMSRNDGGFGRDQQSYYGLPVLHKAHWRWEIIGYFWAGGMMAGSAAIAAFADAFGNDADKSVVRTGRYAALIGSGISGALLVKDLGRPERFLNMLRILKLGSPMSVGSWALSWFSLNAGLVFADQAKRDGFVSIDLAGFIPIGVRNTASAASAALMALYTGVLISATAIPVWYAGRRFIPAIFVASGAGTACSLNIALLALSGAPASTMHKLEKIETLTVLAELFLIEAYRRDAGTKGDAFFKGPVGKKFQTRTQLLGLALPLALNVRTWFRKRQSTPGTDGTTQRRGGVPLLPLLSAGLALYGGYILRETFIVAGRISGDDPKPVLEIPT